MLSPRHVIALFAALLIALAGACGESDEDTGARYIDPETVEVSSARLTEVREQIKATLREIHQLCKEHQISGAQIRDAFNSVDWDDEQVDRLDQMPEPIKGAMKRLRSQLEEHNKLIVATFDAADAAWEGRR